VISAVDRSGDSDKEFRGLDFAALKFPSDGLSIGTLRERHRELFDRGFADWGDAQPKFFLEADKGLHAGDIVGHTLFCERFVAIAAYADARGIDPPQLDELPGVKEDLAEFYVRYGLASGPQHAAQLIRDIERQGAELAKHPRR